MLKFDTLFSFEDVAESILTWLDQHHFENEDDI